MLESRSCSHLGPFKLSQRPSFRPVPTCSDLAAFQAFKEMLVLRFALLFILQAAQVEGWKWMAKIKAPSFSRMQKGSKFGDKKPFVQTGICFLRFCMRERAS